MRHSKHHYLHSAVIFLMWVLLGCSQPTGAPTDTAPNATEETETATTEPQAKPVPIKSIRPPKRPKGASRPTPSLGPNIIMFLVDTLRADRLGCYGYDIPTSPGIDAFADEAIQFEHAYSTAPWTLASVGSLMTGIYPSALGVTNELILISDQFTTLAEALKERGYDTASVISHVFVGKSYNLHQGFDFYNEDHLPKNTFHVSSPGVSDVGISYIQNHQGDAPFFLYLHYFDPHYQYMMHDELLNTYPDYEGRIESAMPIHNMRMLAENGYYTEDDYRYLSALYDSEVRLTDYHIERVLIELKRLGLYDNSLIIFVSDHGEELAEREDAWIGHSLKLTQELIHVPLIIKLPHQQKGMKISDNVSLVDLMPTITQIAGAKTPDGIDGVPIDLSGKGLGRQFIYSETMRWALLHSMINGKWKYVHDGWKKTRTLFDLTVDPFTHTDLASKHSGKITAFRQKRFDITTDIEKRIESMELHVDKPDISLDEKTKLHALGYIKK